MNRTQSWGSKGDVSRRSPADANVHSRLNAAEERVAHLEETVQELRAEMARMFTELLDLKQVGQIEDEPGEAKASRPSTARSTSVSRSSSRSTRSSTPRKVASSPHKSLIESNEALLGCQCWLEIAIGGRPKGRMVFDLWWDLCPKTCENFRALCTGERGRSEISNKRLHYKGSRFHRILPGFISQGGDIINHDGTSGESIYGTSFPDENFLGKHDSPGILSMANAGPDTNGSQFFITTVATSWLDGKNVAFGRLVEGMSILRDMERVGGPKNGKPKRLVIITNCGLRRKASNSPIRGATIGKPRSRSTTPKKAGSRSTSTSRSTSRPNSVRRSVAPRGSTPQRGNSSRTTTPRTRSKASTPSRSSMRKKEPTTVRSSSSRDEPTSDLTSSGIVRVFMDFEMDNEPLGRIVIELRGDILPRTANNFRALCTGELGYGYQGSKIHRIYQGVLLQGGDITTDDGLGGRSAYSTAEDDPGFFEDENYELGHDGPGVLSMANCGANTNTSQFMILLRNYHELDGKNVAFGRVVVGLDILRRMNEYVTPEETIPSRLFAISACGQL